MTDLSNSPLAVFDMNNARIELHEDIVYTVFEDGARIPACPNGNDTMIHTVIHEFLHSAIAEALDNSESHCLRAVADGDGKRWTPERRYEEGLAYSIGNRLTEFYDVMKKVYG